MTQIRDFLNVVPSRHFRENIALLTLAMTLSFHYRSKWQPTKKEFTTRPVESLPAGWRRWRTHVKARFKASPKDFWSKVSFEIVLITKLIKCQRGYVCSWARIACLIQYSMKTCVFIVRCLLAAESFNSKLHLLRGIIGKYETDLSWARNVCVFQFEIFGTTGLKCFLARSR